MTALEKQIKMQELLGKIRLIREDANNLLELGRLPFEPIHSPEQIRSLEKIVADCDETLQEGAP